MGNIMMILLTIVAIFIGVGVIFAAIWILVYLYHANKKEVQLKCTCGRRAFLFNRDEDSRTAYAYMCQCGVKGYIGYDKEEAFYGWTLRYNYQAYLLYITAKHGGK